MAKTLQGTLVGMAVDRGETDLDATLGALGIDDDPPLLPAEKRTRVAYSLAGNGNVITVVPEQEVVFVHRAHPMYDDAPGGLQIREILLRLLRARVGPPEADPELVAFDP